MRESYLKGNVIREYLNACDAWFISRGMRDSWIICFWSWKFRFPEVFPTWQVIILDMLRRRSCDSQWPLRCFCLHQIHSFERAGNLKLKKVTNGPQGTVEKPVHLVEKGLNKLRINLAEVNPTHRIEPEVCLPLQLKPQNGVSHFKHPSCTVLEYARDLMR